MGVKKYGFDRVHDIVQKSANIDDDDMLERMVFLGEQMCNHARDITTGHADGGYDDHTGNLRSSIGYRIFRDGRAVSDGGFKNVGGKEGESAAREALDRFSDSPNIDREGWTLLIVAGMDYAQHVEDKGYNVLFLTKIELSRKIEELKSKLGL